MATIAPFEGIRFDPRTAGPLEAIVSPPYDVISSAEQDSLYDVGPHNVVRIILNRSQPGDLPESAHGRAADALRDWLASGILVRDSAPAYYVYRQTFREPGSNATHVRTGFFCSLQLEPYSAGVVLPHEETRTKAREDRLRLMRATCANPEPIFGLFEDPDGDTRALLADAAAGAPDMTVDVEGDQHEVFTVSEPTWCARLTERLRDRRVWIADGHHRYETALAFSEERPDLAEARSILIVLAAFEDPGMVVLPTHRMVRGVSPEALVSLEGRLAAHFDLAACDVEALSDLAEEQATGANVLGMLSLAGARRLTLRDRQGMAAAAPERSEAWRALDVSVLQELALDSALGITSAALASTGDVAYTRSIAEAVAAVNGGACDLAFILQRPPASAVRDVAIAGDKMPPKSTFFYPKLWSGLLMRTLE